MFDVITAGSSTIDVFAKTDFSELVKIIGKKEETELLAYPIGSKILINELEFTTGGGATNTAVALARLGHKVACISKGGSGANMAKIIKSLKKDNVDSSLVVCSENGRTGYSIILDSIRHDRTILAFKGSNNDLDFSEIDKSSLKTKWFYFCTMMGKSFKTLEKLAGYAEKNNIKIAFNISQYLAEKGPNYIQNILNKTAIFILNKEEASLIAKGDSIEGLSKKLLKLGPKLVVITDGRKGAHAYDGIYLYSIAPRKIKVVETTGAGDAFGSSFLSGIMKKNNIEFALQLAQANAESVIQYHGAKNKLLTYSEALKIIGKNPCRITRKKID